MTDYESLLARIIEIQAPAQPDDRSVEWVDGAEALGVARTYNNRVELFIPGPEIEARLPSVRETSLIKFGIARLEAVLSSRQADWYFQRLATSTRSLPSSAPNCSATASRMTHNEPSPSPSRSSTSH